MVSIGLSTQETLGAKTNRKFRRDGAIICQVFTPSSGGTTRNDELVQLLLDTFEGEKISEIVFIDNIVNQVGNVDGKYWQTNVEINFFYEVVK